MLRGALAYCNIIKQKYFGILFSHKIIILLILGPIYYVKVGFGVVFLLTNRSINMATVEQCETQPGLPTLSKTLDLFNTYKSAHEEEKDSDEESFHLPMLDCDDDVESNNKEGMASEIDKDIPTQNGETEDDILNKFETNGTPDIDPKIEDRILEEIDEICDKKPEEETKVETSHKEQGDETNQKEHHVNDAETIKEVSEPLANSSTDSGTISMVSDNQNETTNTETLLHKQETTDEATDDKKIVTEDDKVLPENKKETEHQGSNYELEQIDSPEEFTDDPEISEECLDKSKEVEEVDQEKDNIAENSSQDIDITTEVTPIEDVPDTLDHITKDDGKEGDSADPHVHSITEKCAINEESTELTEKMDIDSMENAHNKPENITEMESNSETMEEQIEDTNEKEVSDITPEKVVCIGNKEACDTQNINNELIEKEPNKDMEHKLLPPSSTSVEQQESSQIEPDKYENSNDSNKSQNLECDDLLDISIIRDADEDNASAIAENAKDARISEKSDNDDDQDEESEKAENELDETEMDQEESLLANDKDDHMDFEDGNSSNLCDNTTSNNTSDSESKDDDDDDNIKDSENDSKDSSSAPKEKIVENNSIELNSDKIQTTEIVTEAKDVNSDLVVGETQDSIKDNTVKLGGKRSLSEADLDGSIINKKIKLSPETNTEDTKGALKNNNKVKTLLSFEKFMQNKKFENKLTRSDLEQFCLQKICEAIMHKTDVGELHQTIKKQEVIIDNLRKDLQQLTKQTRDLDIVNKKLMNELKSQNGSKKPLVPLKITRSVGLQVKLNVNAENNVRRKAPVTTPRTPNNTNAAARPRTIPPANAGVVRQVAASPRKTPTTTPLLSQALQNRQINPAVKRTPIRPKPVEPQKPANPGVIDLTDEDDKAAKTPIGTPVKILNKTQPISQAKSLNMVSGKAVPNKNINSNQNKTVAVGQVKTAAGNKVGTPSRTVTNLPQGVRLTPTQVKNGSITIPASVVTSNSGTTQLMYVVQPTSSLGQVVTSTAGGAQKAVLLNFQPTNGVLSSALNGSAVSVIPTKTANTVQLKTVPAPRKHPAPLPVPPPIAVNASLKPLLPKPHLSIRKTDTGIILQWRMPYNLDVYEGIASYQLFAYQETNAAPSTDMWRKVGDVKALALPMACTLTQFADKNKYYFAVRSVDVHKRIGAFSDPEEISL